MPLSTREILLVLRARDEASGVIAGFAGQLAGLDRESRIAAQNTMARGNALSAVGVSMAIAGAAGIAAFASTINAAKAYDQQAAKTKTQTDKVAISLQQIKDMGRQVANSVPVDFKTVQDTLYTIFSSIDTDAPGAAKLLKGISEAAVAGQADPASVAKSTLAVLNAYHLGADGINQVNDTMFQLVRKGVGDYNDFSSSIGRAIPSAAKAGISFQELAGGVAFLTRNGLTAAQASTSMGRALDALDNPKTTLNFKQFGLAIYDAQGKMRPLADIIGDMKNKLSGMSDQAKAATLNDLFKGSGGTIQAMRFFNDAMKDSTGLLPEMISDMQHANGVSAEAYATMKNTPQSQLQLLKNRWQSLRTEIGDMMIPILNKLVSWGAKLIGWFENLSPLMKKIIIYGALITSVFLLIAGPVIALIGIFATISGMLALAGTSMVAILTPIALVITAIALLAIAGYELYTHWDTVKRVAIETWDTVYKALKPVVEYVINKLKPTILDMVKWFQKTWDTIVPVVERGMEKIWRAIEGAIAFIWPRIQKFLDLFKGAGRNYKAVFDGMVQALQIWWDVNKFILNVMVAIFKWAFPIIATIVSDVFHTLGHLIGNFVTIVTDFVQFISALFTGDWSRAWTMFKQLVEDVFNLLIQFIIDSGKALGDLIMGIFGGMFSAIGNAAKDVFNWFAGLSVKILNIVLGAGSWLIHTGMAVIQGFWDGLKTVWQNSVAFLVNLDQIILNAIGKLDNILFNVGEKIIGGLWDGMRSAWDHVKGWLGSLGGLIPGLKGPPSYDAKLLINNGKLVMQGFRQGMQGEWNNTASWLSSIAPGMHASYSAGSDTGAPGSGSGNGGKNVIFQAGAIVTQEINPVKHAADLGWLIASRADA